MKRLEHNMILMGSVIAMGWALPVPVDHIEIPTLWFQENSTCFVVDPTFYAELDSTAQPERMFRWIAQVMQENPTAILGIYGYADGREQVPQELGYERCKAVQDSLIAHGVTAGRLYLESKGDGGSLVGEATLGRVESSAVEERLRQRNRRVEFSIRSFDWKP